MTRYSTARYFLYRENPFRVLAHGGKGFVEPPRTNKRDADFHVWWFTSETLAKQIAHSVRYTEPAIVAERGEYYRRVGRSAPSYFVTTPKTFASPSPKPPRGKTPRNLEDLA